MASHIQVKQGAQSFTTEHRELHTVLSICFSSSAALAHFTVRSFLRVAACSKSCQQLAESVVQHETLMILRSVVQAAASHHQHKRAAVGSLPWILKAAGPKAISNAALAPALLSIPRVPASVACQLLDAGLPVTLQQLVKDKVPGLQAWLQGQLLSKLKDKMNDVSWALMGVQHVSQGDQLPSCAEVTELLHLLVSCKWDPMSDQWLALLIRCAELQLQGQLSDCSYPPQLIADLMASAAQRSWPDAASALLRLPTAANITAEAATPVLLSVIKHCSHLREAASVIAKLMKQAPSAHLQPVDATVQLLHAAAAAGKGDLIGWLLQQLPAADLVRLRDVVPTAKLLLRQQAPGFSHLCQLHLLQSSDELEDDPMCSVRMTELLQIALQEASLLPTTSRANRLSCSKASNLKSAVKALLNDLPEGYIDSGDVLEELQKAVLQGTDPPVVKPLATWLKQLETDWLADEAGVGYLRTALYCGDRRHLEDMCGVLCDTLNLDSQDEEQILAAAVCSINPLPLQRWCKGRAWAKCGSSRPRMLQQALTWAVQAGNHRALEILLKDGMDRIESSIPVADAILAPAAAAAVLRDDAEALRLLCRKLESWHCLASAFLAPLMHLAVELSAGNAFVQLWCRRPAADVSRDHVRSLRRVIRSKGSSLASLVEAVAQAGLESAKAFTSGAQPGCAGQWAGAAAAESKASDNLHQAMCWQALGLSAVRICAADSTWLLQQLLSRAELERSRSRPPRILSAEQLRGRTVLTGASMEVFLQLKEAAVLLGQVDLLEWLWGMTTPVPGDGRIVKWTAEQVQTATDMLLTAMRLCRNPPTQRHGHQWWCIITLLVDMLRDGEKVGSFVVSREHLLPLLFEAIDVPSRDMPVLKKLCELKACNLTAPDIQQLLLAAVAQPHMEGSCRLVLQLMRQAGQPVNTCHCYTHDYKLLARGDVLWPVLRAALASNASLHYIQLLVSEFAPLYLDKQRRVQLLMAAAQRPSREDREQVAHLLLQSTTSQRLATADIDMLCAEFEHADYIEGFGSCSSDSGINDISSGLSEAHSQFRFVEVLQCRLFELGKRPHHVYAPMQRSLKELWAQGKGEGDAWWLNYL